ncbi:MAG: hypothetical protein ACRDGB_00355 [Candidatus Limnocylindria bacterium]
MQIVIDVDPERSKNLGHHLFVLPGGQHHRRHPATLEQEDHRRQFDCLGSRAEEDGYGAGVSHVRVVCPPMRNRTAAR